MRRGALLIVAAVWGGACGDAAGTDGGARFAVPLGGTLNQTYFYLNYVDEDGSPGIQDYTCGPKTYDGHQGTDISLPSFAVMDSGVAVRAVAAGEVVAAHDGEFDRQKAWIPGAAWNVVAVRHADGIQTIYGHLKKNSVAVSVGQMVVAGTVLGQVGSSGFSDVPHLHFEVHDAQALVVDPWQGLCGAANSRWSSQLAYQNTFALLDAGLTGDSMTLDLAKDPPVPVDTLSTAAARVSMWVELLNVREGTAGEFRLYQPDGALHSSVSLTHARFYSLSWWWAWHAVSGYLTQLGTWRMQYRQNGAVLAERAFVLVAQPAGSRVAPSVQVRPASGIGGGWARGQ